jgi:hypothetical protein
MTKVQLANGQELLVEAGVQELQEAFEKAVSNREMLEIASPDGRAVAVNPRHVLYFEGTADPAEAAHQAEPDHAVPARAS